MREKSEQRRSESFFSFSLSLASLFSLFSSATFRLAFFLLFSCFFVSPLLISQRRGGRQPRLRARRGSPLPLCLRSCSAWARDAREGKPEEGECGKKERERMQQQQQHLLSRAASHASSSSSSRAACPRCPAPPLCWRRHHGPLLPFLARKERAATLRVSLQRFSDGWVCRAFFFSWSSSSAPAFLSRSNPFFPPHKKRHTRQRQLFAAHPQGQRGDTLLQPVDYSVSFF